MEKSRPRIREEHKSDFYAAPKDRSKIVKIEIWEKQIPHLVGSGSFDKFEHIRTSVRKFYRMGDSDVIDAGDHFVIPQLNGLAVYRLNENELKEGGLL
jgi:hypothetical protein